MTVIEQQSSSTVERRLSDEVRQAAMAEVEARALTEEEVAALLGISQTAVYRLSMKDSWPLMVSISIAEALGLHVRVAISANGTT